MTNETLAKLREPFPPAQIGHLPRVTCKACSDKNCQNHQRQRCNTCKAFISTQHIHLDYVGHAEVTDRLLSVDPEWSWEPVSFDAAGLPTISKGVGGEYVLWIRLTVAGMTRLGVGSVFGGTDVEKQLVSDALRNAAMRFGVGLALWAKTELEAPDGVDVETGEVKAESKQKPEPVEKVSPFLQAVLTAAERAGLEDEALNAFLAAHDTTLAGITRDNCGALVTAIQADAA